jgi:DNA-binding response OmpR family regulator
MGMESASRPAAGASAAPVAAAARRARLLLVEDDDDTRQLLGVALGRERYDVDEAASATDALLLLRRNRYDLVLTDYDLPGETGSSLLKRAAGEGLLAGVATVVLTAHPQPEGVSRADVIRKPLDLPKFLAQVRHILISMARQPDETPGAEPAPARDTGSATPCVELVLYVSADSPASQRARRHLESALAPFDARQYTLEVCDLGVDPARGEADHVVFTPTLVTRCGGLANWVLGDLADRTMLLDLLHVCGVEPSQ